MAANFGTYNFVNDLAVSVPEIRDLVNRATREKWDATRFGQALQATKWWNEHSGTARQQIAQAHQDPATYAQNVTNAQNHVRQVAARLGVHLTDQQITQFATSDLYQGLDDNTLQYNISSVYSPAGSKTHSATGGGDAAGYSNQIRAWASAYGIPMSQQTIDSWVQNALQTGSATGAQTYIISQAKNTYKGLSGQIDENTTVEALAGTYKDTMAQVLELDPASIKLTDPTIQRALQGPGAGSAAAGGQAGASATAAAATGTGTVPLWQFQDQLRQDPRWQKTDNARQTAFSLLHGLGKTMGFAT